MKALLVNLFSAGFSHLKPICGGDRATKKALLKDRAKRLLLQNMSEALAQCPERLYIILAAKLELVSKELNHFGVIAGLFRQIGGHSSRFVLFCSF